MGPFLSAGLIGVCVFFALSTGHFFPWHVLGKRFTDDYGRLKRIPSYLYGVGMIGLGLTVWMEINAFDRLPLWGFWFFAACAGAGTAGGYWVDRLIDRSAKRKKDKRDGTSID
jgi:4-hydroxybenzoate polyprenyltransferase